MSTEQQIQTLSREQLILILSDTAPDSILRWVITNAALAPIKSIFLKQFGKCDHTGCFGLALYSGNANRGGRPLRCHDHRSDGDEAVAFAEQFAAMARGMQFAA